MSTFARGIPPRLSITTTWRQAFWVMERLVTLFWLLMMMAFKTFGTTSCGLALGWDSCCNSSVGQERIRSGSDVSNGIVLGMDFWTDKHHLPQFICRYRVICLSARLLYPRPCSGPLSQIPTTATIAFHTIMCPTRPAGSGTLSPQVPPPLLWIRYVEIERHVRLEHISGSQFAPLQPGRRVLDTLYLVGGYSTYRVRYHHSSYRSPRSIFHPFYETTHSGQTNHTHTQHAADKKLLSVQILSSAALPVPSPGRDGSSAPIRRPTEGGRACVRVLVWQRTG
jgi:hypothetical protein